MKLKLASSSILVVVCVFLSFLIYKNVSEDDKKTTSYHLSKWNEYSKQIDNAEPESLNIDLKHVYGLVLPHHIPTTLVGLTNYYRALSERQKFKNVIVLGPDHIDVGNSHISVSKQKFVTSYSELFPYKEGVDSVLSTSIANIDEKLFENEHSIGAQVLLISKFFPNINILPIAIRSDIKTEEALKLGEAIALILDKETLLVASVDFSHYLPTSQAEMLDDISGLVVRDLNTTSSSLVRADSSKSMLVFMHAMHLKGSKDTSSFKILNTNDFMQNSDYTTGYVFGFWGVK